MSTEADDYRNDAELELYREYRKVQPLFEYVVETERRFYLTNEVEVKPRSNGTEIFYELQLRDAWVWDIFRSSRYIDSVTVITYHDVNVEHNRRPTAK